MTVAQAWTQFRLYCRWNLAESVTYQEGPTQNFVGGQAMMLGMFATTGFFARNWSCERQHLSA